MKNSDSKQGFVDFLDATDDVGQQHRRKDKYVEHGEDVENGEAEEHKKTEEREKLKHERKLKNVRKLKNERNLKSVRKLKNEKKAEEHKKDEEKRKFEDHSICNSEKLDKLIQMVHNLGKRVEVIENVLGVKVSKQL